MASGACEGRIKGRTHGRTNQQKAEDQNATCQLRAVHTRPILLKNSLAQEAMKY
jgi:hypothetical protein